MDKFHLEPFKEDKTESPSSLQGHAMAQTWFPENSCNLTMLPTFHLVAPNIHTATMRSCAAAIHNGFQRVATKFHHKLFRLARPLKVNHYSWAESTTKAQLPLVKCNHRMAACTFLMGVKKWHSSRTRFWSLTKHVPSKCHSEKLNRTSLHYVYDRDRWQLRSERIRSHLQSRSIISIEFVCWIYLNICCVENQF